MTAYGCPPQSDRLAAEAECVCGHQRSDHASRAFCCDLCECPSFWPTKMTPPRGRFHDELARRAPKPRVPEQAFTD